MIRAADLLEPIIRLRALVVATHDPKLRQEVRELEFCLRRQLGPSVPKRPAAQLLGVSVTALDRHIDSGLLPAVISESGKRMGVETTPLLELATAVRRLRAQGRAGGVIGEAARQLGWRPRGERLVYCARVAELPRPNESVAELQRHYSQTSPADRMTELFALNASAGAFAGRGLE